MPDACPSAGDVPRCAEVLQRFCADSSDPCPAPTATIIAAHQDDEVVGAGGRVSRLREVAFIHVTDGAPRNMQDARDKGFTAREDYSAARRVELRNAIRLAGFTSERFIELGFIDQEASLNLIGVA